MNTYQVWHVGRTTWHAATVEGSDPVSALARRTQTAQHALYVLVDATTGRPTVIRTGDIVRATPRVECSEVR